MSQNDSNNEFQALRQRLGKLGKISLKPQPFMDVRVLAELKGRKESQKKFKIWQFASFALPALAVALMLILETDTQPGLEAKIGTNYALKISLDELGDKIDRTLDENQVALVRIELPPDVEFYSATYPQLKKLRFLELPGKTITDLGTLPLVIKGFKAGDRSIIVRFLDENRIPVSEKEIKIRFRSS